jgi:hypothetical protein
VKIPEPYAFRLHERLSTSLGESDVFLDQFSIQPGEVYGWTIQQAAAHADAMIVLIGPDWLTAKAASGHRRLDDNFDFVRREMAAAIDRRIMIAPLLVSNAEIPDRRALPWDMYRLPDFQFFELSKRHWADDVTHLLAHLRQSLQIRD